MKEKVPSCICAAVCAAGWLAAGTAAAVEVKLSVEDPARVVRKAGVVTTGVPFARGAVKDVSRLSVRAGGKVVPAQFLRLAPWDDGSVRWALLDTQVDVPAGGRTELLVRDDGANRAPPRPVKVEDGAAAVKVSAGPLEFTVDKKRFNLFASLKVDGKELVNSSGRGLALYKEGGGQVAAGPPAEVKIEQAGPMRAIVCAKGRFPGVHNKLLGYTARITAFAGRKFVKVQVWLENDGAYGYAGRKDKVKPEPEWFAFDGMAVELGLGLGGAIRAACEGAGATGKFSVEQRCLSIFKKDQWKRDIQKGFRWDSFEYKITAGGKELKKGDRTDGVVALKGSGGALTVAIRHFWQNYGKAVELDGSTLRLWLWPRDGEWPRELGYRPVQFDLADMMKRFRKPGLYQLPGAVHKGHEFILDFSGRSGRETGTALSGPLMARASPPYYAATGAAPGRFAPADFKTGDAELDFKFSAWTRMARNAVDPAGKSSIHHARRTGVGSIPYCWYGWMDFGDLYNRFGSRSLHYDWPGIMLTGYLRTGDRRFLNIAAGMSRHRIDVDQCWSDRDLPKYRRLARPDAKSGSCSQEGHFLHFGPTCSVTTWCRSVQPGAERNWLGGVVLYYMLTGEPKARECCLRNYRGMKEAWIEPVKKDPAEWRSTLGSAWSIENLCALYDLTAEKKYLEDALALFNKHIALQWKARGPHLAGGGNSKQCEGRAREYCYSIRAFCGLHRRTGEKKLMKMLDEGCRKEFPEGFYEASLFLADLYAYVGRATKNDDLLEKAAEAFIEGFPESKSPPCFTPGNHWSRDAGMMLRAGHILQHAKWKSKAAEE